MDRAGLAAAVGRGVRQIAEYVQRGLPRESDGRYCVEDCRLWIDANIAPTGRSNDGRGIEAAERARWEAMLARERALMAELERRKLEGELVEVDEVARRDEQRITHAHELLLQVPDRLVGLLPKGTTARARRDFRERVAEMIEDVLRALADAEVSSGNGNGNTLPPPA